MSFKMSLIFQNAQNQIKSTSGPRWLSGTASHVHLRSIAVVVFYPFPILNKRSEISSTSIYITRGVIHPGGWTSYHTWILTFKRPGLHGCVGFNSGSELHIAMEQGWLSALLLTRTTLGCTLDWSPQWTVTLGKDNTRLCDFPFGRLLRHAGSQ